MFSFIIVTDQASMKDSFMNLIVFIQFADLWKFFIALVTFEIFYSEMMFHMSSIITFVNISEGAILTFVQIIVMSADVFHKMSFIFKTSFFGIHFRWLNIKGIDAAFLSR